MRNLNFSIRFDTSYNLRNLDSVPFFLITQFDNINFPLLLQERLQTVPQLAMVTFARTDPEADPRFSTFLTTSYPSTTSPGPIDLVNTQMKINSVKNAPNTTWAPSSQEVTTVVMKNWEPLVFLPALAMERRPGLVCFSWKFSSKRRKGNSQSPNQIARHRRDVSGTLKRSSSPGNFSP